MCEIKQNQKDMRCVTALPILNNSPNRYIRFFLMQHINECLDDNNDALNRVFDYIISDGFDVSNVGLFEIPTDGVYVFCIKSEPDIEFAVFARQGMPVTAGYFTNDEIYTDSISSAIDGYKQFCAEFKGGKK
ncbi:hypothetical protein OBV_p-00050 (plasmid) [Oscillibacter valericigenes Sjm18-20]|nr:hypothetical protein OBV_p-00050 [Oscillibacter valericigenes Sjm18-20]